MIVNIIYISAICFFVVLGGFFAGAETGMYQLNRLRLRLGVEKKQFSFILLSKSLHDSPALLISMLIGTNIAFYLTTSIVTYMLLEKGGAKYTAELFATLIIAPILFIFAEVLPKSIFFYRADSLMPLFAPVIFAFHKIFTWCGAVPLLKAFTRIFAGFAPVSATVRTVAPPGQEHRLFPILKDTEGEDFLSSMQKTMMHRLTVISSRTANEVMTPFSKVWTVEKNCDRPSLLKVLHDCPFTRLPVCEKSPANIIGYINIYQCLTSGDNFDDLSGFIKPIEKIPANTSVIEAIDIIQQQKQKIILVTKSARLAHSKPAGIITMKDLAEELLGELTEW